MSKQFEYELQLSELKKKHIERYKTHFFDVQIECRLIILPAHRYILSSHSTVLGKQLASGVNKLSKSTIHRFGFLSFTISLY